MKLTTHNLAIGYERKIIQDNLNLTSETSKMIALLGTNGTGKSTLLRTLASLQPPLEGEIKYDDKSLVKLTPIERAKIVSVVLTDTVFSEQMTVYDLICMGRIPYTSWTNKITKEDDLIIKQSAEQVNLQHKLTYSINKLSDGERQRASIARALAQNTPMILLDEPTSHLDLPNRIEVMLLLKKLAEENNKTIIISTHEINLALQIAHYIWFLTTDHNIIIDTPKNIIKSDVFLQSFSSNHFKLLSTGDYKLL